MNKLLGCLLLSLPIILQAFYYPPHAGFPLGEKDSPRNFLLEMHYDNPGNIVGMISY